MKKGKTLLLMSLFLLIPLIIISSAPQSRAFYMLTVGSQNLNFGDNSTMVSASWTVYGNGSFIDVYVFTDAQYAWWNSNGHPTTAPSVHTMLGVYNGTFCVNLNKTESYTVVFANLRGATPAYLPDTPVVTFSETGSCPIPAFELMIVLFGLFVVTGIYLQRSSKFNLL